MAPHSPHTAVGEESEAISNSQASSGLTAGHNEAAGVRNEAGGTLTLKRKLAMCAGLVLSDALGVFSNLNEMPVQQALGTPVSLVTVPGAVSGFMALVLVPLIGWIADGGACPHHRKKPITIATFCVGAIGLCLNLSGAVLAILKNAPTQNNTTTAATFSMKDRVTGFSDLHQTFSLQNRQNLSGLGEPSGLVLGGILEVMTTTMPEEAASASATDSPQAVGSSVLNLPLPAVLSMAGFMLMDLSFDVTSSSVKALMLSHSAPTDHVSLLSIGVFMAAVGGCFTSVSGLLDLGGLFPDVDPICSQAAVQMASLFLLAILCCACSVLSAPRVTEADVNHDDHHHYHSIADPGHLENDKQSAGGGGGGGGGGTEDGGVAVSVEMPDNVFFTSMTPGEALMSNSVQLEQTFGGLSLSRTLSQSYSMHTATADEEKTHLIPASTTGLFDDVLPRHQETGSSKPAKGGFLGNQRFQLFILWLAAFLTGCSIFTYNAVIADYMGKVIYGGNPQARAGRRGLPAVPGGDEESGHVHPDSEPGLHPVRRVSEQSAGNPQPQS
ncbi:uncharacterized protein LOC143294897 [Babylonia areolata]|uniref:uncharacterized protein LOC143294897 n=1 Tax=Babylonia areolata TaxID=304850 RepID=UPI003FCF2645